MTRSNVDRFCDQIMGWLYRWKFLGLGVLLTGSGLFYLAIDPATPVANFGSPVFDAMLRILHMAGGLAFICLGLWMCESEKGEERNRKT